MPTKPKDEEMTVDTTLLEDWAQVMALPSATSSALDLRLTLDASDERLPGLVLRGRYLVTIKPIKE